MALAGAGVAAGGIMAHTTTQDPDRAAPAKTGLVVGEPGKHSFAIRGNAADLVPGRRNILNVRVSNPSNWPIVLRTIIVEADNANARCRAEENLRVGGYHHRRPWAERFIVPANGKLTVPVHIRLIDAPRRNQNACKNAEFSLHYSGTAGRMRK